MLCGPASPSIVSAALLLPGRVLAAISPKPLPSVSSPICSEPTTAR
jgi:hypothetical protein